MTHQRMLFIAFTLLFAQISFAQYTIQGRTIDPSNEPIPFASILVLIPEDSSLVKDAVSNVLGVFSIELTSSGQYFLGSSAVGYSDYFERIEINEDQESIQVGALQMEVATQLLNEIVVEAKKPLFEQRIDRTGFATKKWTYS